MLQDARAIRYYQRLSDALVDHWDRGYRYDELRLYAEGFIAALRHTDAIESYLIHRLEEEITRFMYDESNFAIPQVQPERR
jgi:hypothetical protein